MHTTISKNRLSTLLTRTAALGLFTAAATLGIQAQQPATAASQPAVNLQASLIAPLELSSSSSSSSDAAPAAERFNLSSEATQPPPRRSYRRPNYSDSHTNPDGSSRYTFAIGGGLTLPTGDTHKDLKTSYTLQVGAGRNFNKTFGVLAQFDWANFSFQGKTLANQQNIYNQFTDATGLDGYSHVWSLSINPIVNYYTSDTWGAYAIGGAGFYHKIATFTLPGTGTYCDPYYGYCYQYQANVPLDSYTSNAPGFSGGLGFTRKVSRFGSAKLYAEARYVWVANQSRPYFDGVNGTSRSSTYFNVYPQNSARTSYIPVTFGFRW
ncbi:MAG: hypothetical protein ABI380_15250 [Edaphobacter sp.]